MALCITVQAVAHCNSHQSSSNGVRSPEGRPDYFPNGVHDRYLAFYSSFLSSIGEPSLFAAQHTSAVSYRLICMFCQRPSLIVVRLDLKPDGSATITTTLATIDTSSRVKLGDRTHHTVGAKEVNQYLAFVEKSDFWSMASTKEPPSEKVPYILPTYDAGLSQWVFEGVRHGAYHVVFREGPQPSRFTDMVRMLAKDLANLDDASVPLALPAQ